MAVVILIISLLLGGLLTPLGTQIDQRTIGETQKALDEIREALIGYSMNQKHLPCPDLTSGSGTTLNDTPNDGNEDYDTGAGGDCLTVEGNIPWATLGVSPTDAWGQRFFYRATSTFSDRSPTFSLSSTGDIRICPFAACTSTSALANNMPAVVFSYGKNGAQALSCPNASRADECENRVSNTVFVSRAITSSNVAVGEFDDIVVWLSPNILFNRMVAASRLP